MTDERARCPICISVVSSGLGRYPFRCANGHTLYRGGGATIVRQAGFEIRVPPWSYRPFTRREHVRSWARNLWPDWPRVALGAPA